METEKGKNVYTKVYTNTELIFGLVGAVGSDCDIVINAIKSRLLFFNYDVEVLYVSDIVLKKYDCSLIKETCEYNRITKYMDIGNSLRKEYGNGIIAMAIANHIYNRRLIDEEGKVVIETTKRKAFIIKSLKHPEEVKILRNIYGNGFYLFSVYGTRELRTDNLKSKNMNESEASQLIARDEEEKDDYGQHTRDTYQLADFFIDYDSCNVKKVDSSVNRIIDLLFGAPYHTPTFDEYAMYMAYCTSLRSADLSRQIGAVICRNNEILSTGVNDCPQLGGGLYWSYFNEATNKYEDVAKGRDYMRGEDSNKAQFTEISKDILSKLNIENSEDNIRKLRNSKLSDLTEYGRVVHAEMEAITMCARNNISCKAATLYATTFPCHNCAKHIISSGIRKVIYIEAYPKSKAFEFYLESITDSANDQNRIPFIPFFGVGPRSYADLFSMKGSGNLEDKKRKDKEGRVLNWIEGKANARFQMLPSNYMERELEYALHYSACEAEYTDPKEV